MMRSEAGFSLLEVLIATAIFAMSSLAFMNLLGERGRMQDAYLDRTLARTIAENLLSEMMAISSPPEAIETSGAATSLNRNYTWTRSVTAVGDVLQVRVLIFDETRRQVLFELATLRTTG